MKLLNFTRKTKQMLFMAFALLVGQTAWAYDIVHYPLTADNLSISADVPANAGFSFIGNAGTISYTGLIAQNSGWNTGGKYWETAAFSTVGYHTIGVSAVMKSDNNTGPKDFRLDYSLDNGATWSSTAVATYSINSANGQAYTANLPQACQNQASVKLRWTNYTTIAVNKVAAGTVTAGALSYIKTVNITGLLPVVPATQAHDITIVSRTPTTITLGWTKGGTTDSVAVMMNTTNSFTPLPVDNQTFTAMTGTYTSGRQVIYIGTKSTFTVNVPSATDQYYFRVFDFQPNNGMERYITTSSDPGSDPAHVSLNPVLCDLENITINPATFKLTRGTMGATITPTKKSTISERAIYWDYNPGVTEFTGNKISDNIDADGSFSFPDEVVGRAVTVYYIASVTNASGTIWSTEASFNNTPIFSGTGNWETAARWNVQEVPGANGDPTYGSVDDSPFIAGTCTLTSSNSVTDLTINSGKKLTINPAVSMNVAGTLANNAGNSGILIKSSSSDANGSLIWSTGNPGGSVEMYSKAYTDASAYPAKSHWQYFGIPVTSTTVGSTFGGTGERVRKYDESNTDINGVGLWVPADPTHTNTTTLSNATTLVPVDGYELVQPSAKTYTFTGTLNHSAVSRTLTYSGGPWIGNHILANPFTAAVNVSGLTYSGSIENAVYIYNAGSLAEWTANSGSLTPGSNPGTYSVSTGGFAGIFGVPAQIPSMQGFLVKATGAVNTFGIPLSALTTNNNPQRAPKASTPATMIDVIGTHSSDRMWIFSESSCTKNFDNGFDGPKMLGSALNTQIYAVESDGEYQIDAVNDINNTYLGFQPGQDTNFKLVFTHQNLDAKYAGLYLVDLVANKTVDITASGTEYNFTSSSSSTSNRFKIITTTTKLDNIQKESEFNIVGTKGELFVHNLSSNAGTVTIYNTAGMQIKKEALNANSTVSVNNLNAGVYIVKAKTETGETTKQLIIR